LPSLPQTNHLAGTVLHVRDRSAASAEPATQIRRRAAGEATPSDGSADRIRV